MAPRLKGADATARPAPGWALRLRLIMRRRRVLTGIILVVLLWLAGTIALSNDVSAVLKHSAERSRPLELSMDEVADKVEGGGGGAGSLLQQTTTRTARTTYEAKPGDPYGVSAALADAVPEVKNLGKHASTVWRRERTRVEATVKQKLGWEAFKIKDGPRKVRHLKKRRALEPEEVDGAVGRGGQELRRLFEVLASLQNCESRTSCEKAALRSLYGDVAALSTGGRRTFATSQDAQALLRAPSSGVAEDDVGAASHEDDSRDSSGDGGGGGGLSYGALAAALPAVHPKFSCHLSCAIVGNAGTLSAWSAPDTSVDVSSGGTSALRNAKAIDDHRCILRINQAPTGGKYKAYVGSRATFRVLNAAWVSRYVHPLSEDRTLGNLMSSLEPNVTVVVTRASLHQFVLLQRLIFTRRPDVLTLLLHPSVTSRVREVLERYRLGLLRTAAAGETSEELKKPAGGAEYRRFSRGGSTPSTGLVASLGLAVGGGDNLGCVADANAAEGHPISVYGFSEELSRDKDSMGNSRGSYHYFRATDWPDAPDLRSHPSHSFLLEGRLLRMLRGSVNLPTDSSGTQSDTRLSYVRWCDGLHSLDACHTMLNVEEARIPALVNRDRDRGGVERSAERPSHHERSTSRRRGNGDKQRTVQGTVETKAQEPPGFPSISTPRMTSAKFQEFARDANREIQLALTDKIMQTSGHKSKQPKAGAKESAAEALERRRLAPITDTIDPIEIIEPMDGDEKRQGMAGFIYRRERQRAAKAGFQSIASESADAANMTTSTRPPVLGEREEPPVQAETVPIDAGLEADAEAGVVDESLGDESDQAPLPDDAPTPETDDIPDIATPDETPNDIDNQEGTEEESPSGADEDGEAPNDIDNQEGTEEESLSGADEDGEPTVLGEREEPPVQAEAVPIDAGLEADAEAGVVDESLGDESDQAPLPDDAPTPETDDIPDIATPDEAPNDIDNQEGTEEESPSDADEDGESTAAQSTILQTTPSPPAPKKARKAPNVAAERAKRVKEDLKRAEAAKAIPLSEIKDPAERAREEAWRAEEAKQQGDVPTECLKRGSSDPCFGNWLKAQNRPSNPLEAVRRASQGRLNRRKSKIGDSPDITL